ncbi:hypothetical protein F2Q68_00012130 [Brassica cretica]|uniref:Major facilitator superfamily (MFS) profile domain-containing protein n=1 Tax=Brassica cretica TaxID=69181 RepID=A0A8S9KQU6_BRACR|nr:hypothetical protein F2Q68_00012130 [Brassica cretica]
MMVLVEEERSIEEGLLELSNQTDASGCRITACVILSNFVAVCGSFSFGVAVKYHWNKLKLYYRIGYTSGAEIGIMKDMGLSIAEFSAFASLSTLGATFGALFSGKMAVVLGRRGTMWVSDILCVIGWLCIAFAKLLQNSGLAMVFFGGNFISWRKMALLGKTNYYFIINMEVMFKYGRKWHIEV